MGFLHPFGSDTMKNIELKTAAAYIRVSTDRQTELSPDSQIKVIRQYAKSNGYIVPSELIFRDDGISGRRADKRPQFNQMIATAKQKPSPFCTVLLWKFSRFARNQEESIFYKAMLHKNNVEVISVSEPLIEGPFGSLIERIIEWSDEYYSIRLSGEVKRGMTEKVDRGEAVSIPAFGYDIANKKYIINETNANIVKKIYADYLNGIGCITIAKELNSLKIKTTRGNVWENRTVEYILRNPVYTGKIRWNPKHRTNRNYKDNDIMIVDGIHEPIINQETFDKVQTLLDYNRKKHSRYTHSSVNEEYMLHGLVKCSSCGSSLSMSAKGQGLQCIKYVHGKCAVSHYISLNKINELVINTLEFMFDTGSFKLAVKNTITKDEEYIDIEELIEKENLKLTRIREAYAEGIYTIDELREYKSSIDKQISILKSRQISRTINEDEIKDKLISKNKNVIATLKNHNTSEIEKNEILKAFVDKIVFDRSAESVDIYLYF